MRKLLVAANNDEHAKIMEVTARRLELLSIKDLEILRAPSKEKALEHISYGDIELTVLEDELKGAEAVAERAKSIGSKLILIDSLMGEVEKFRRYIPIRELQKPLYHEELSKIVRAIYGVAK